MSDNLLKTGKCKAIIDTVEINDIPVLLEIIQKNFESGFVFAFFKDKALFGRVVDGKIKFHDTEYDISFPMLEEMRVFNKKKELYVYRKNQKLSGRLREDREINNEEGSEVEYVRSEIALWGTTAKDAGENWTELFEDRGIRLTIPFVPNNRNKINPHHPVHLVVHSYIEYLNNNIQASYSDARWVAFTEGGEENE